MQCINKIKAGYTRSGDITFNKRKADPGIEGFQFECRKCLPCRLNIAREKAVRAIKEAEMHEHNHFITLTYSDEHLKNPKLQYHDFQNFVKRLREHITRDITDPDLKKQLSISYIVTGEYGEKNKRPHWHAIFFNLRLSDLVPLPDTELGHKTFFSPTIERLWGFNDSTSRPNVIGSVTIESAGYVARYASKKLVHGLDHEHDYQPIHKTSSRHAIGKTWIEKHWKQVFSLGYIRLPNGSQTKIPRYFSDWLKKNHPKEWRTYVTEKRLEIQTLSKKKNDEEEMNYLIECLNRQHGWPRPPSQNSMRLTILKQKFKKLQERLKL